ncbi:MAG: PLP-dependent aminotransferase family protein [Actinomycetota bacterium]|nr:PLP-dependent aminotransferase family protein [Actinomycetota bacterium]
MEAAALRASLTDDARGERPLFRVLADELAERIREGELAADTRLPAERTLARQLAVSRGTVVAAYDELRAAGLVATRQGSGTVVARGHTTLSGPREAELARLLRSDHGLTSLMTPGTAIDMRAAHLPDLRDLPAAAFDLAPVVPDLLRSHGYHRDGTDRLRIAIASHLTRTDRPTSPEEILVTTGAQQAIWLVVCLLVERGGTVVVPELCYPGALDALRSTDARIRSVPVGPRGVDVDALDRIVRTEQPRLVYLDPTAQNPTGRTMPAHARRRLVRLAPEWSTLVVEDNTLAPIHLGNPPPPSLSAIAGEAGGELPVMTVGSASKWLWGGLRVGWIRGPGPLLERLARMKAVMDLASSVPGQIIAARLLDDADTILAGRLVEVRRRYDALADSVSQLLPDWEWTEPDGGLSLWVRLPDGASSFDLVAEASRNGVAVAPGPVSSTESRHVDHLRLPYCQPPDVAREAVARLARSWDEVRRRHTGLAPAARV